ncbi:MAG: hypothetical protein GWP12_01345 [Nitrospirae bacterium]|nr:hypothetical protein [Nitrospirota bacterium]
MIKKIVLAGLILFLLVPAVYAKDITMSVNQTDYYFITGEEAAVPLEIVNSYDTIMNGQLSYTITQEISQQGLQYSSSNTQSTSFPVEKGEHAVNLGFGTVDSPMTLKVALTFSYNDNGPREVTLPEIILHFVSQESEKNNTQNNVQSSSQSAGQQSSQQNQNMQQMIDQMFGNQQPQQPQNPQDRLQNSQLSQDSSALKQQMEKQLQQQQQMKQEFQQQLARNIDFQKAHQELLQQGYNATGASLNPTANDSGTFEINYEKANGEKATLKGEMQEGKLTNIQKWTAEDEKRLLDLLNQSGMFQEYQKKLDDQGYSLQNTEFSHNNNSTGIRMNYLDKNNHTAAITAEISNNTVKKVELEKEDNKTFPIWLMPLILAALIGTFIYRKYAKRDIMDEDVQQIVEVEPFDYKIAARSMLDEAATLFREKKYKEAYSRVGQTVRLFLRYEQGLDREITNDEIIHHLKTHRKSYSELKECFDLCTLVVFAKYEANERDFAKMMTIAEELLETGNL